MYKGGVCHRYLGVFWSRLKIIVVILTKLTINPNFIYYTNYLVQVVKSVEIFKFSWFIWTTYSWCKVSADFIFKAFFTV